jgi:predicted ester cyclase
MHHWTLLLDSFPDGIMEEYQITRDDPEGQKMNVSWVFSGTHIFPFFGVEPRHKKITLRGKSFFTFKGEKINQMVLSWNYRDALMQLMG